MVDYERQKKSVYYTSIDLSVTNKFPGDAKYFPNFYIARARQSFAINLEQNFENTNGPNTSRYISEAAYGLSISQVRISISPGISIVFHKLSRDKKKAVGTFQP